MLAFCLLAITAAAFWIAVQPSAVDSSTAPAGSSEQPSRAPTPHKTATQAPTPTPEPTPTPTPEPTPVPLAERTLAEMTLEQKVGQLFFLSYEGENQLDEATRAQIEHIQPGGLVYFAKSAESPAQLKALLSDCRSAVSLPLFLAVDEEGGSITRISNQKAFRDARFPSQPALAKQGIDAIREDARDKARFLQEFGFTMNFAPVADVVSDPKAALYSRSYGGDTERVAEAVQAAVAGYVEAGMGTSLKHFPGMGNSTVDTHKGENRVEQSLETLIERDLPAFRAGVEAGATSLMFGHIIESCWGEDLPASLSPKAAAFAREQLGDSVLLLTDSLQMAAVTDRFSPAEGAYRALSAGMDMALMPNPDVYDEILEKARSGELPLEEIDAKVLRILRAKESLGLLAR